MGKLRITLACWDYDRTSALANGTVVADGLGMLLEQAAEAFAIWRGVRPNTQALLKQLSL